MTNQTKKEYLGRYRVMEQEMQRLQEELARWESRARKITSVWGIDSVSGSGEGGGFQSCIEHILEFQGELKQRIVEGIRLRRSIAAAIESLPDVRLRQLMHYRYIDGLTIVQIADKMAYSTRQVDNLLVTALRKIEIQPEKIA